MTDFDNFCAELLEEAKRFYEKAKEEKSIHGIKAYQNSSLLLAICALEAYVNGIAEEMTLSGSMQIHIKGVLLEKEVRMEKGEFVLTNALKMTRLTERIELLFRRHKRIILSENTTWWPLLKQGIDLRNKLTHPKENTKISTDLLAKIIQSVIDCLSDLYKCVYRRNFPKSNLSLISKLDF